jgi:ABC-type tungstate transport system permease subunit
MYNDFVIVGPRFDPAGIQGMRDAREAFAQYQAVGEKMPAHFPQDTTRKSEDASVVRARNAASQPSGH